MAKDLFSVPIFFILFRETLEAAIIVSVLLALVEQLVKKDNGSKGRSSINGGGTSTAVGSSNGYRPVRARSVSEHAALAAQHSTGTASLNDDTKQHTNAHGLSSKAHNDSHNSPDSPYGDDNEQVTHEVDLTPSREQARNAQNDQTETVIDEDEAEDEGQQQQLTLPEKQLLRKLRIQIFAGAATGLIVALAIGGAFIAVFYTQVKDLYGQSEDIWEGVFSLVAALMIWVMAISFLRMDRAKLKWKIKLEKAFVKKHDDLQGAIDSKTNPAMKVKRSLSTKYALFFLPAVTVMREGLEAVVFLGGVSLGESGTSIPIAAITGLLAGLAVGYMLYKSSSRLNLSFFLVGSTAFLLLIGAGLLSKSVGYFETYKYAQLVGGDIAETGSGPGSYSVHGNVWHLNCCNPEDKRGSYGWQIFNAIFGWTNNATVGTILAYVFYWFSVLGALIYMKWSEGRCAIFGLRSKAWHERQSRRAGTAAVVNEPGPTAGRSPTLTADTPHKEINDPNSLPSSTNVGHTLGR